MLRLTAIAKISGFLVILLSLTMLPPILVNYLYNENHVYPFSATYLALSTLGMLLWLPVRNHTQELRSKDGFIIVVLIWVLFSFLGAIPFWLSTSPNLSFTDAVFETISGLTTTGATVIENLDNLPKGILYYRQQLQFLGGLGVVLLAVAILPTLGIGGMQLLKAEATGPVKDQKLTPRVTETARRIWFIYLILTLICAISFKLCGMDTFDAIGHSFSTIATGGFSTHDASMGFFKDNLALQLCTIVFMILGAISLPLHFIVMTRKKLSLYWQDTETRIFLMTQLVSFVIIFLFIQLTANLNESIHWMDALFQVVSFSTTTGFITAEFYHWPLFLPMFLLILGIIGGCSGSTSGGFKMIRVILLQKQGLREITRLIHPHGKQIIKLGKNPVPSNVLDAIWGFLSVYVAVFCILLLMLLITEPDFLTASSALISTISNTGPALGNIGTGFQSLSDATKWILSGSMLIGRLEFFTIIIIFMPSFWRH